MEVTGRVKVIGETQTFGASGFRKRELVVETNEQYPQTIMIEFVQDNVNLLDQYPIGTEVKVYVNLRGREWTNPEGVVKYFNSIQGWRIEGVQSQAAAPTAPGIPTPPTTDNDDNDDLPF